MTVKLVEAAPVAGALRFEILSEGRRAARRARREKRRTALSSAQETTEETMTQDLGKVWAERMTKSERDMSFPDSEPRDAATLMLIDRSGASPKVLLGRRHAGHKFMPGKFVLPRRPYRSARPLDARHQRIAS